MGYLLNALWRVTTHTHQYIKWFCYDKPNRIERGYVPDGLYDHERSHADQERAGMRNPDEQGECAAELRKRWR